jgi:hypothetical protein
LVDGVAAPSPAFSFPARIPPPRQRERCRRRCQVDLYSALSELIILTASRCLMGKEIRGELFNVRLPTHPSRTKWTRRVPHPVLIGHAASLTPY